MSVPSATVASGTTSGTGTRVRFAGTSEAGRVRAVNQDSYFAGELPGRGVVAVVADGMGGHKTGEVASQRAVEIISRELEQAKTHPPSALAKAVQLANLEVYDQAAQNPEHRGMGTTLTVVFIDDQVGLLGHIGDSRAYLVRAGEIKQLTQDHSWVADRVRQGVLTEEEARHHRWRNVITNALGAAPEIKLDLLSFDVQEGDRLLLCSDGVSTLLPDETLARLVETPDPAAAVGALIDAANDRGSPDNITAVVMVVERVEARPKRYALSDKHQQAPESVKLGSTMSGIRKIEEAFPAKDFLSKLRKHPLYGYRFWIVSCLYLLLLFLFFSLRG